MLLFIFLFIHFTITIFITIPGTPERYYFNPNTGVANIRGCGQFLASLVYIVFSKLFKVLLFDHLKNINGKKVEKPTESFFSSKFITAQASICSSFYRESSSCKNERTAISPQRFMQIVLLLSMEVIVMKNKSPVSTESSIPKNFR